jgi:hypothetical protein
MGDSGEGLVDAEARIQERMEELQRDRRRGKDPKIGDPEAEKVLESLRLARVELERQANSATHAARKAQISRALEEVHRRMSEIKARRLGP